MRPGLNNSQPGEFKGVLPDTWLHNTVFAGKFAGILGVDDIIWPDSFMNYDSGFFDDNDGSG